MWLGLMLREELDGDPDLVTLCVWAREPTLAARFSGPPGGMADLARMLRLTQGFGARFALPRCPHCRAPLDVPDIDAALDAEAEVV